MTRTVGLSRRLLAGITGGVLVMASSCSGGDDPSDTLGPLDTTAPASLGTAVSAGSVATSGATTPSGPVGSGFVSIQIRLASSGIEEVIALDRATVAAADLVPISLDAGCTALDGGDGLDVAVTDLRRLSGGNRVISARLHVDPPTDAPGAYEGTLEIGDGQQVVTTYRGDVTLDEGMASGSFDVTDDSGGVATGSFVCAAQPVTTTTAPVSGGGEQVPGASAPVTGPAVPTLPPVIETLPPLTVPEATS